MGRKSKIERLHPDILELIGRLRDRDRTIDEILAKLGELDVEISRAALTRHVEKLDRALESVRRSRAVAKAIVAQWRGERECRGRRDGP